MQLQVAGLKRFNLACSTLLGLHRCMERIDLTATLTPALLGRCCLMERSLRNKPSTVLRKAAFMLVLISMVVPTWLAIHQLASDGMDDFAQSLLIYATRGFAIKNFLSQTVGHLWDTATASRAEAVVMLRLLTIPHG